MQDIQRRLSEEGTEVKLRSLYRLCDKFQTRHTVRDIPRVTRPRILTKEMLSTMEDCLRSDDELTARRLKAKLREKFEIFQRYHYPQLKEIVRNVAGFVPAHIIVN